MKQHITVEQLSELSDENIVKLITKPCFFNTTKVIRYDEPGNLIAWVNTKFNGEITSCDLLNFFTVGKMIEILFKECFEVEFYKNDGRYDTLAMKKNEKGRWMGFNQEELCDALWEAIKEVI